MRKRLIFQGIIGVVEKPIDPGRRRFR